MFKRYELHNHTTQSDASITCEELIDLMVKDQADVFALTDHNTISGHPLVRRLLEEKRSPCRCIYGMEYTTYYGHILCLNLERYVPWDSIDRRRPELLFDACRKAGAVAGIAHPFSYGDPFARGCRFEMTVTDFSKVDFIEIFNDPEPLHEVNEKGLLWWQQLVLRGEKLAATCGMDLHGAWNMAMQFATYAEGTPEGDPAQEIADAIHARRTWVSKGLLALCEREDGGWRFRLIDMHKPGFAPSDRYTLTLTSASGTSSHDLTPGELFVPDSALPQDPRFIPMLYGGETILENLICVSPVLER